MLKEMCACERGIDHFLAYFPDGKAEITKKNIYKFWNGSDDFDYFFNLSDLISEDDYWDWHESNNSPEKAWAILKKYKKN
jgi:hypothetical protein